MLLKELTGFSRNHSVEKKRAIIFLDHANLFHSIKYFKNINLRIDYKKLIDMISQNYYLTKKPIAYLGVPSKRLSPQYRKKMRFIKYLKKAGFNTVEVKLKVLPDGTIKQKYIDKHIRSDMIHYASTDAYDVAILISGDKHFALTVKSLQKMGKQVQVWSWDEALSFRLVKAAGAANVHYLDDIFKFVLKSKLSLL
ncbi:MAG: NYN domain-containing protein [Promethearchaeota archaeon]